MNRHSTRPPARSGRRAPAGLPQIAESPGAAPACETAAANPVARTAGGQDGARATPPAAKRAPARLQDKDRGQPAFIIDVAAGAIVEASRAGWIAWGLDAASIAPPVAIDRAMPALHRLAALAGALSSGAAEEWLTFWSARGLMQLRCHIEPAEPGQVLVRALDGDPRDPAKAAEEGARRTGPEVTATARLAHELRTPLSAVIAYAEILKEEHFGPLADARYRDYARHIYDGGRHALSVVDGMLGGGAARSGVPELAFADLDPARIVENCLAVARPLAEQAGLELLSEVGARIPRVVADELSLRQMLFNLITNAIKFARPGDRVTVGVTYQPDGSLHIAVADTGPGMSPEPSGCEAGAAGAERARNAGLGIGLPLTRALAEANGAAVLIDSEPGRGTCVTIAFAKDRVLPV